MRDPYSLRGGLVTRRNPFALFCLGIAAAVLLMPARPDACPARGRGAELVGRSWPSELPGP